MTAAIVGLGTVVEAAAWWLVASRRLRVWGALAPALGALGVLALVAGPVALSPAVAPATSAMVGVSAGVALYLATRAFVFFARPWRAFRRHARAIYGERAGESLGLALVIAVGAAVVGEELFWRGLAQERLSATLGRTGGAAAGWIAYVAANLPSMNLAIVAGAIVGGGTWVGLAFWTQGVLASLICHGVWTALMIAFPVVPAGESS